MDKALSLARKEEERRAELLAGVSNRVHTEESSSRDQRTQEATVAKRYYGSQTKNTKAKSKSSCKTKRTNAASSKQHEKQRCRRDNKNREQDRGDEGENTVARRSASELEIEYPGSYCDKLSTIPHYWKEVDKVDKEVLFQCKRCYKYLWLPAYFGNAKELAEMIWKYGLNKGYCKYLSHHSRRAAKIMLAKLQKLDRLSNTITDKVEFARLADKILREKEYDRKEV